MTEITKEPLDYQGRIFAVTAKEYDDYMIRNIVPQTILGYYEKEAASHRAIQESQTSPTISDLLSQRGSRYGEFSSHAQITQELKNVLLNNHRYELLDFDMKEAIEMVFHKIGRIVNGDPNYLDSWDDIQGYTKLVSDRLRKTGQGY